MTWIGLAKYITDLTLLEITPISPDIAQNCPISSNIARYRAISPHIAQNMGQFNVTITVMVRKKILPLNNYGPVTDPVTDPVTMLSRSSHGAYRASMTLIDKIVHYILLILIRPVFLIGVLKLWSLKKVTLICIISILVLLTYMFIYPLNIEEEKTTIPLKRDKEKNEEE